MDTLLVAPDPGALQGGKHRTLASCCAVLSAVPHEISSSPHSVPPCYPFQKIFTAGDDRRYQCAFLLWPVNLSRMLHNGGAHRRHPPLELLNHHVAYTWHGHGMDSLLLLCARSPLSQVAAAHK